MTSSISAMVFGAVGVDVATRCGDAHVVLDADADAGQCGRDVVGRAGCRGRVRR